MPAVSSAALHPEGVEQPSAADLLSRQLPSRDHRPHARRAQVQTLRCFADGEEFAHIINVAISLYLRYLSLYRNIYGRTVLRGSVAGRGSSSMRARRSIMAGREAIRDW
jgi:hypothetical protein